MIQNLRLESKIQKSPRPVKVYMKTPKFAISCKRTRLSALSKRCNDRGPNRPITQHLAGSSRTNRCQYVIDKHGRPPVQKIPCLPKERRCPGARQFKDQKI